MLILQIALGIVLGALILFFLPAIVAGVVVVGLVALVLLLVLLAWFNLQEVAVIAGLLGAFALLFGIPFLLMVGLTRRYPKLGAVLHGGPPYDTTSKLPMRIAVMAPVALAVAGIGAGVFFGAIFAAESVAKFFAK